MKPGIADVKLPFIVLVRHEPETKAIHRSVLHGAAMQQWLAEMVDAFLETPNLTPQRVMQTFLEPFLNASVLRLLQFAVQNKTTPALEKIPPPMSPPPPAYIEEMEDHHATDDMSLDTGVPLTFSSLPVPKGESTGAKSRQDTTAHNLTIQQQSKQRESMVQQFTRQ